VKIIAPIFFISNDDPIDIQVLISKYWYPSIDIQLKCRNYLITIRTKMTIATLPSQRISTLRATPLLLLTCALASFLDVTCFDASWQGKCWPPQYLKLRRKSCTFWVCQVSYTLPRKHNYMLLIGVVIFCPNVQEEKTETSGPCLQHTT
jgi:hypothetical protein